MKISKGTVKPGERISIDCKTFGNSSIALLGVDQSVTLLGSRNDISKARIAADINGYNANENHPELKVKGSAENRYSDFGVSNAFILTNAQDGKKTCMQTIRIQLTPEEEAKIVKEDDDESGLTFEEDVLEKNDGDKIRKNFPETWIFKNFVANDTGRFKYVTNVPDTTSSFVVTGFAIHPLRGLAIASQQKVTVSQDFFLKLHLPYSVRLGEILRVDVSVFNYNRKRFTTVSAKVELFNNEAEFVFIDQKMVGSECTKSGSNDTARSKTISVANGNGASTFFLIKALVSGQIKIKVKATTPSSTPDEVERLMLVEHEGLTKSGNVARLLRPSGGFDSENFYLPIPTENIIGDSISIEASVIGDLIGPALSNIHNLM